MKSNSFRYMNLALRLARKVEDKTYPNPMVGCVVVKHGKIIAKGYHRKSGLPHAEIEAIKSAKEPIKGAEMFVTLEPCDHYGKTPPCTDAVIESGIKKVYVAMKDPNPIVAGRGIKKLRSTGIGVETGLCEKEARHLNRKYIKFITRSLPYITLKLAQSLDGKIAARDGSSKWISNEISRKRVKKMRESFDAIMVGSGTLAADDPFLLDEKKRGYATRRVVIDTRLKISVGSNLIKTAGSSPVIIGTTELASAAKIKKLSRIKGVEVIVTKSKNKKVNLKLFLKKLASKDIVNILAEGGGTLAGSLIDEGLVDEAIFFIAPKIIGGDASSIKGRGVRNILEALELKDVTVERLGGDVVVRGVI